MSNTRRGFLAMLGVVPGWFLGKALKKEDQRGVSGGLSYVGQTPPYHRDLDKWLCDYGYNSMDAKRIASEYFRGGLGAAVSVIEDWDDDGNDYSGELCSVIHYWYFGK